MTTTDVLLILVIVALVAWRLSTAAGRLDRVHIRRDRARRSLFIQLASRTSAAARLVTLGVLPNDAAEKLSFVIEKVAVESVHDLSDYISAESDLTQALGEIFDDSNFVASLMQNSNAQMIISELSDSCKRVSLARRFHNDAVGAAQLLHKRKAVRYLRLAGNTALPQTIDMDDSVPRGLEDV
jgi:hypothetical protein